jgi:hypothetical protein
MFVQWWSYLSCLVDPTICWQRVNEQIKISHGYLTWYVTNYSSLVSRKKIMFYHFISKNATSKENVQYIVFFETARITDWYFIHWWIGMDPLLVHTVGPKYKCTTDFCVIIVFNVERATMSNKSPTHEHNWWERIQQHILITISTYVIPIFQIQYLKELIIVKYSTNWMTLRRPILVPFESYGVSARLIVYLYYCIV